MRFLFYHDEAVASYLAAFRQRTVKINRAPPMGGLAGEARKQPARRAPRDDSGLTKECGRIFDGCILYRRRTYGHQIL